MEANNTKAMREALEKIAHYDYSATRGPAREAWQIYADITRKALAEPPRNCDVGTAEEQIERHGVWCGLTNPPCCKECEKCFARWAQMPYKKGGEK